ncbi:MAG: DUF1080 domain-containing protein [Candidatus Aminicenantes bacterium]|nr:DUF1080 domain-containing protein [Candidatus Aminicenantes bacterium]
MKIRTSVLSAALFLAVFLSLLSGQVPNPSLSDRVSALLLKFPAETAAEREAAASELIGMGTAAVVDLCGRLAPPGKADDSLVRYALDAVTIRAGRPGAYAERMPVIDGILTSLETAGDPENSAFLVSLLQRSGQAEIIKPLSRYLSRPELAGPVVRALAATGLPEAADVLLKALKKARGSTAGAIIRGLADLGSREAVPTLMDMAAVVDPEIRSAALDALADIGDPAARPLLERVRIAASHGERAAGAPRLLRFARRLSESGRMRESAEIARALLSGYTAPGEEQIRSEALSLLATALGEREGAAVLLEAAASPDREFRWKALDLAAGLRTAWKAASWIDLLDGTAPDIQADIIRLLDRRGETAALPAIREKLRMGEGPVKAAAAVAAARMGGPEIWEDLVPLFASQDPAELWAAGLAASFFSSDVLVPRISALLPTAAPAAQVAILGLLAERKAESQSEAVLALASSSEESVRTAALRSLEQVTRGSDLPALAELLKASEVPAEIVLIQNAAVAAAGRVSNPAERAAVWLQAMSGVSGPKRIDFIRPLSRIGGEAALEAVRAELQSPDPQAQAVAVFTLGNWPEESAIPDLFALVRNAVDKKTRYLALQGIGRLVPASSAAPEAKISGLREALTAAVDPDEKVVILNALAAVRQPEALELIDPFLDDPALRGRAAQAVLRLVMPATGYEGLNGFRAAAALKKALPFIDNEFDRVPGEMFAAELLSREGFKPLFNGKDLSGWKGLVADPPNRARMAPTELRSAQAEADELMRAHWQVIAGGLVFDGKGHSLCTAADYGDFEMFVDWKISPEGDSGIYLRGSPQVQIWDPAQWPEGSGGLYNNQKNPNKPAQPADRPVGEWNTFYIRMVGERVTVDLNGVRVVDGVVMENYWERDKPIYPSGQIELQAHSTPLEFRNIFLREIPEGEKTERPEPFREAAGTHEEGFVSLFNGRDLAGWTGDLKGYTVENGAIVVGEGSGGNLFTVEEYADFVLRFEFKLAPGANNGIGIRTPPEGDAAYVGMEIQVLDDSAPQYQDLKPYQYHGSVYGVIPARRGFLKPVGEWNTEEIAVRGRTIKVVLNGTTIVEADLDEVSKAGTVDGRDHPGLARTSGHIAFCGHGSRVEFRNVRIKILEN